MFLTSKTKLRDLHLAQMESCQRLFKTTLKNLRNEILKNIEDRHQWLAVKDMQLLRSVNASIIYLGNLFENEPRMCLPPEVHDYLHHINVTLRVTHNQMDVEHPTPTKLEDLSGLKVQADYLSILDVQEMHEYTSTIIHFLITEFDATRYTPKPSLMDMAESFLNRFRHQEKSRPQISFVSDLSSQSKS